LHILFKHCEILLFSIKCEIDRLFDELQLKRPELYGFKTDGPLRKLKVLDAHWKSQPTNSKSYEKKKAKVGVGDHVIRYIAIKKKF